MFKLTSFALALAATVSVAHAQANPDLPLTVNGTIATIPVELNVGYGPSLPGDKAGDSLVDPRNPSRATGGERISIAFRTPKNISAIRLTAYSKSGVGKILVRNVVADSALMPELFKFDQVVSGMPENYQGLVMLPAGSYVASMPNRPLKAIDFVVEGFAHNDATILLELDSAEGFALADFVVKRRGSEFGNYFDESAYHNFSPAALRKLVSLGKTPGIDEMNGTTWVCSHYTPSYKEIDFKTRHYFSPGNGVLQSSTDKTNIVATWILTQEGWKLPLDPMRINCGDVAQAFILRYTPSGNLITETAFSRHELVNACLRRGFTMDSINWWLDQNTYRSSINNAYNVTAHEFCRPASL